MRTEQAPQRQPAPWDRAETPEEQEGQAQDLPCAGLHEVQEHPAPWAAARATVPRLLLLLLTACWVRRSEAEDDAPPTTKLPAGMKKASTSLAANATAAATKNREVNFMSST